MARAWSVTAVLEGVLPKSSTEPVAVGDQGWRREVSKAIQNGVSTGKANWAVLREIEIASGATETLDLTSLLGGGGPAAGDGVFTAAEVAAVLIKAKPTNTTVVTVEPNATDGWTALLGADGSVALAAGDVFLRASKMAVSGASKKLDLVNAAGAAAKVEISFILLLD